MLGIPENKVAIIPLFDPDVSPGGIIIPEMAKDRCDQGIVKYCGPRCEIVKEGDYVLFPGYTGQSVFLEGEGTLIFMREDAITARIEGQELEETEVPGLYFKGKDGVHFQANVEFALDLISKALQDAPWRRGFKSINMRENRPREVVRGG